MTKRKQILSGLLLFSLAGLAVLSFRLRFCRTLVLREVTTDQSRATSIAFVPFNVRWKIWGEVQGTGTVTVPYLFSNTVSGPFAVRGDGDYYDTNVSIIFIPKGEATGNIRASFFFNNWY